MSAVPHPEPTSAPRSLEQAAKLRHVVYEIRGPANAEAARLEREGHQILKLNIGNPAAFGFDAPDGIIRDMIATLPESSGYSESRGIMSARRAIASHYEVIDGFPPLDVDSIYLGNGVSELIIMSMQALLDDGDEVLVPAPDYPLWTAAVSLAGGTAVHYRCDETDDWQPDLADIEAKVSERTKAILVINPNNPTGSVYTPETLRSVADVARRHGLLLLADEIYDKILYDGAVHTNMAAIAPDLLCLTYNGLSKAYRSAGFRSGWVSITGPRQHAAGFLEGIELLASSRLCPNVPGQHAVQVALSGRQSIRDLVLPGGRLHEQRDTAVDALNRIPGVTCVQPKGAIYVFPRLDPNVYEIPDDAKLVFDLLVKEKVLLVQGTGFNWPETDHIRIVTLPLAYDLQDAIERFGNFLSSWTP